MVLVAALDSQTLIARLDQLRKSVDLAIRDLLASSRDPVALAVYLWVCQQHNLPLVNSAALANWGASWAHRTFVDKEIGRRRDDQLASAALAVSALKGSPRISEFDQQIGEGLEESFQSETARNQLPFDRADYGSMFLLAVADYGIVPLLSLTKLQSKISRTLPGGRAFGIGFAAALLKKCLGEEVPESFIEGIEVPLSDPETDYQDRIYLTHAFWLITSGSARENKATEMTEDILTASPIWLYLLSGEEDIPPAGDRRSPMTISHLCRAALLDLLLRYSKQVSRRAEEKVAAKYRGRKGVGLPAFGFYALCFATAWFFLLQVLISDAGIAWRYLFVHEYGTISWTSVLIYQFAIITAVPLLPITFVTLKTLWTYLVSSPVESDQRIREVLQQRNRRYLRLWFGLVILNVCINIYSGLINPAIQHMIDGK